MNPRAAPRPRAVTSWRAAQPSRATTDRSGHPREGGQAPLQRRLPKRGFKSLLKKYSAEITLGELDRLGKDEVDLLALKAAGLVKEMVKTVKVIKSGELKRKVSLKGIGATVGAKAAIEAAGGKVEAVPAAE